MSKQKKRTDGTGGKALADQPEPAAAGGARGRNHKREREFEIDIFQGWCKSCGICAAFCPRECIELDEEGSPMVKDGARCSGCGWCEIHCPDFAISVRPKTVGRSSEED